LVISISYHKSEKSKIATLVDADQLQAKRFDLYELDEEDYEIFAVSETTAGKILLVEGTQKRQS
jgi:hypothetical protein